MARVKIITDSTADIPPALAQELGITVVPVYVHFGDQTFRAGIDITNDQFYRRLAEGSSYPYTSSPAPIDASSCALAIESTVAARPEMCTVPTSGVSAF